MPIGHTPPQSKEADESQGGAQNIVSGSDMLNIINGRFGAVTRAANQVKEELSRSNVHYQTVQQRVDHFETKIRNYESVCDQFLSNDEDERRKFKENKESWQSVIDTFRNDFQQWLNYNKERQEYPDHDRADCDRISLSETNFSQRTNVSETSSCRRLRMLERKSALQAKKESKDKLRRLEDQLRIQQQQADEQKRELENSMSSQRLIIERDIEDAHDDMTERELELYDVGEAASSVIGSNLIETEEKQMVREFSSLKSCPPNEKMLPPKRVTTVSGMNVSAEPFVQQCQIRCNPPPSANSRNDSRSATLLDMEALLQRITLPPQEPTVFDGLDYSSFSSFMRNFKLCIENKQPNRLSCLSYLESYTKGLPNNLVRSAINSSLPDGGYENAITVLNDEYGNECRVSEVYLQKINDLAEVRYENRLDIQNLAVFLHSCYNASKDLQQPNQLNGIEPIQKIVSKLPDYLKRKWRSVAADCIITGSHPQFKNLCDFIQRESMLLNTPIYGIIPKRDSKQDQKPQRNYPKRSFAVATDDSSGSKGKGWQSCLYCGKSGHSLSECYVFKKETRNSKEKFVRDKRICYGCLQIGHIKTHCENLLSCEHCSGPHPSALHIADFKMSRMNTENQPNSDCVPKVSSFKISTVESKCMYPCIPVRVKAPNTEGDGIITYMGLDTFSSDVFISEDLYRRLGLVGPINTTNLTTMQGENCEVLTKIVDNLEIFGLDNQAYSRIPVAYCKLNNWPFDHRDVPKQSDIDGLIHLQHLPLKFIDAKMDILVGSGQSDIMQPKEVIAGPDEKDLYVTRHKHGYAINGSHGRSRGSRRQCFHADVLLDGTSDMLQRYCAQEFLDPVRGICASQNDLRWEAIVRSSHKQLSDGHYEVSLPFKERDVSFPENRQQVLRRLLSIGKRMNADALFAAEYIDFMRGMLDNGFAERVPPDELNVASGKCWYLAHFAVIHKQKKKMRIVFDASLRYSGICLNDKLWQGPDLTNKMIGLLLRFRQEKIAFTADIQKMFYQVKVTPSQRNFLRFLWYPGGDTTLSPVDYRVTVHIFGAVSSPSIANFTLRELANIEKDRIQDNERTPVGRDVLTAFHRSFYVDDLLKSVPTVGEAVEFLRETCKLLLKGGFLLTSFSSCSREVLQAFPKEHRSKNYRDRDLFTSELPSEKALGVYWNTNEDKIGFKVDLPDGKLTKRGILSTVFSFFDPYGLASPMLLPAKIIFQKACGSNLDWDEPLPPEAIKGWSQWLHDVKFLRDFNIPRCYKTSDSPVDTTQLHIFCDGSNSAYAAVAYYRILYEDKSVSCSLIMSKTRLVPKKGTTNSTTPRIELNSAKLAVQLYLAIKEEQADVDLDRTVFWTDSTTVLQYDLEWRHVPTKQNAADIASRGCTANQFFKDVMWIEGPAFLRCPAEQWPANIFLPPLSDNDEEFIKVKCLATASTTLSQRIDEPLDGLITKYSNWHKMLRIMAYVIRFTHLARGLASKGRLMVVEVRCAERAIWKWIQDREFHEEIKSLRGPNCLVSKGSRLRKLLPFIDDMGLLRVGGRLSKAQIPEVAKRPIILPNKHPTVELLIRSIHQQTGHMGREMILATLRQKYWIQGPHAVIRRVIRTCLRCRRYQGRPQRQLMAELPRERVSSSHRPFYSTGIDCFGPFLVRYGPRGTIKRYGVIFTCMASRAIHIEVAASLSTDSFLNALRRFIARRGAPDSIRSDNGTNFVGADRELRAAIGDFNTEKTRSWMLQNEIRWSFQPPAASHFGGVWEREIRSIRKVMNGLMLQQNIRFQDDELLTMFCEVESILNSRPLTAASDDPDDFEVLTPNHLLRPHPAVSHSPGVFRDGDLYQRRRWRQVQYLTDLFWRRWRREYLPLLQERHKWTSKEPPFRNGDLVLVVNDLLRRNLWSLGRIVSVGPGKEQIRRVTLKVATTKGELRPGDRTSIIERPISKLIRLLPLDLDSTQSTCK